MGPLPGARARPVPSSPPTGHAAATPLLMRQHSRGMPLVRTQTMPVKAARRAARGRAPLGFGACGGTNGSLRLGRSSLTEGWLMIPPGRCMQHAQDHGFERPSNPDQGSPFSVPPRGDAPPTRNEVVGSRATGSFPPIPPALRAPRRRLRRHDPNDPTAAAMFPASLDEYDKVWRDRRRAAVARTGPRTRRGGGAVRGGPPHRGQTGRGPRLRQPRRPALLGAHS